MSYTLPSVKQNAHDRLLRARNYTRKVQMLELFTRHRELKPGEYARLVQCHSKQQAWAYLRRHWVNGYLRRSRDWRGRLVYSLGSNGARYLLWWHSQFPDAKVSL